FVAAALRRLAAPPTPSPRSGSLGLVHGAVAEGGAVDETVTEVAHGRGLRFSHGFFRRGLLRGGLLAARTPGWCRFGLLGFLCGRVR
ncbi:hypothetical protein ACFVH9_25420, partial [Streptomyces hirsutus]|uniref:hypothetical protein n=1 Tax=Streptomyces hirsutus TaxID=35620 RepID=UPI0036431FC9